MTGSNFLLDGGGGGEPGNEANLAVHCKCSIHGTTLFINVSITCTHPHMRDSYNKQSPYESKNKCHNNANYCPCITNYLSVYVQL